MNATVILNQARKQGASLRGPKGRGNPTVSVRSFAFWLRMTSIVTLSLLALPLACAHGGKRHDWVNGPSELYPLKDYFIGVGAASMEKGVLAQQRELADNRARAEIAKIFQTEVSAKTEEFTELTSEKSGGQKQTRQKQQFSRFLDAVSVATSHVLEGAQNRAVGGQVWRRRR